MKHASDRQAGVETKYQFWSDLTISVEQDAALRYVEACCGEILLLRSNGSR
jgi:hypothetical protein